MLFYTVPYLLFFLPISIFLFFYSKYLKVDPKIILIFLSIFFYSWWNIYYLPVILSSILINYYCCKKIISRKTKKKKFLVLGIILNVLLLVIFKYADFIIQNINLVFSTDLIYLNLPFPLAISFFTFQSIAFLVNVYDEDILDVKAKDFFLFIVFFPQLIAGPIVKYNNMMPQFNNNANYLFNKKNFMIGLIILLIGLVKKIYFAGTLSEFVDLGHENINDLNFISSWLLSLCFTFQFYFDFSGYVDMATGSALMFNIVLPQNFNSPFKAISIIDFWQRWHITLSNFLTNYIYYPLLRSLKNINFFNSMVITFVVFLIAGFWHGPSWLYVIFGVLHGIGLILNHIYKKLFDYKLNKYFACLLTFNYINFTFIFFRSENLDKSFDIINGMLGLNGFEALSYLEDKMYILFILLIAIIICFSFKNTSYLIDRFKAEIKK